MKLDKSIVCLVVSLVGTGIIYEISELVRCLNSQTGYECFSQIVGNINNVALICCWLSVLISGVLVCENVNKIIVADKKSSTKNK